MSAMDHVRYLAEHVGPRGSTTVQEETAAGYAADVLHRAGLEPVTERFTSARSAWLPYTLAFGLILIGQLLFWIAQPWGTVAALLLTIVVVSSLLLELAFRPNPLRWLLPRGESQNVWVRVPPQKEVRERVVLLAHLDTHRTPLVFSTDIWVQVFRTLVPLGLVSVLVLAGLLAAHVVWPRPLWQILALVPSLLAFGIFALTLQADASPYTVGANDNASGVGVVLELARRLAAQPLDHTLVWLVLTGCEEVGCYGADAFARTHTDELDRPLWIAVDNVGGADAYPTWLERETFFLTARSDPDLLALAEQAANRRPELHATGATFRGAYTEGSIGHKHGYRVLTFLALREDGGLPNWHRPSDVLHNVDPDTVTATENFLWELLLSIDRSRRDPINQRAP